MNMRKKILIPLLAIVLVAGVAVQPASAAWGRGWHHHGGGCIGCGFAGGLILGGVLGGALAAPYYYAPPPVYVGPPPPACYTQPGYWSQVPSGGPDGFTTYQNVWMPPQTVCR